MNTYKIVVAYDGTPFYGWQIQPDRVTVSSCLQEAFKKAFHHPIRLFGASRTDTGVHALGQVATFQAPAFCSPEHMRYAWNNVLPSSIVIREVTSIDETFHPQWDVRKKIYWYHLFYRKPLPFIAPYGWSFPYITEVRWDVFYNALQCYIGEHDFASFCKREGNGSTVRSIDAITWEKMNAYGALRIGFHGKGFLRYQIRRMIGTALDVARRPDYGVADVIRLLKNPHPEQIFLKAEACGLMLRKIIYSKKHLNRDK
jgi:tRNA pseudouridine38-40 synthase